MNNHIVRKTFNDALTVQILSVLTGVIGMVVDGAVTGSCLGVDAMAAYGIVTPILTIFAAVSGFCSTGISTLCGRSLGSGDIGKTNRILSTCIAFSVILSVVMLLFTVLGAPYIAFAMGASEDILPMSADFLRGFGFCAPAMLLVVALMPVMQIDGDRNRVFIAVAAMTAVNVTLDLANGFLLHGGLLGMALATTLSYYVALLVLLMHFLKKNSMVKLSFRKLQWGCVKEMISYGLPNATQQICRSILVVLLNHLILSIADTNAVAVYAAILSAANLCMSVGSGIGQTTSMITSVYAGERDRASLKVLVGTAVKYSVIYNAALCIVLIGGAGLLMPLFLSSSEEAMSMAVFGFRLFALSMIFYSINVTFRNYFQAMHNLKVVYAYVIADNLVCIAISAFVLGSIFGLSGIWASYLAGETITLGGFLIIALIAGRSKGKTDLLSKAMMIPDSFDSDIISTKAISACTVVEILNAADLTQKHLLTGGAGCEAALYLAVAVEEIGKNIVEYGFADGKRHSIDIRIIRRKGLWTVHIRDDCPLFSPMEIAEHANSDDPFECIGVKMVYNLASEMEYTSTLKMNNLKITIKDGEN